jgi:transcriptional regulator with XRE-family HTH domain
MQRIRELRNQKGVSQARLAVEAGMDPATLNRIEQGKGNPNLKTLEKLADALGVSLTGLLEEEAPKAQAPPPPEDGERGSKKTADALAVLLESKVGSGEALIDDLRTSGGEFPLVPVGEFIWESWAVRTIHDAQPPEVREAPRVRAARGQLEEVESQLNPLLDQWFGPTALDPDQWEAREKFSRARSETRRSQDSNEGDDTANEADAS